MKKEDNPGVPIPPPLIYAATFFVAVFIQKMEPINDQFLRSRPVQVAAFILFAIAIFLSARSLTQFFRSKNTLITIKAAQSLQTTGIYQFTRNPMYLSLLLIYLGLTCLIGNCWNIILLPVLFAIVQEYIIKREEKYLDRRFGKEYHDYKSNVRRWI